jgi:hypothetical protein
MRSRLLDLKTRPETAAYVVGVMTDKRLGELVVAGSVVLAYSRAGLDFDAHRRIGDGVLASEVAFHGWLTEPDLCVDFARRSYSTCYRLLGSTWDLYVELADRLPDIIHASRDALSCRTRTPAAR